MLRWLFKEAAILVALLTLAVIMPFVSFWLVRTHDGAMAVFFLGPLSAGVLALFASQILASKCWRGRDAVRQWRAENGGYGRTVPAACGWLFGSILFSYLSEVAIVFLTHNVYLLPVGTYAPLAFAIVRCRRG